MKATSLFRRLLAIAALAVLGVPPGAFAQEEGEDTAAENDPPPFEVPDVSEADFPFAPPADFAGFVPIHQLEMEAHPDGQTAAQRRKALRAVPKKSVITPRAAGIADGARVLGWHPYWAEAGDYLSYDYSNLTHVAYFSAEVGSAGSISSLHGWNTDPVVETAHSNGVKVLLTATLFGETANHALLTNSAACTKLITNLVAKTTARGGDGICIDFESVGSWSGATKALTAFMSNLVAKAHAANLEVSICLPSVDWYADFAVGEYEKIGVDYSIIMGYDYYYAGSATPGPVAPLYSSAQWQGASSWCSVDYSTRYYLNKMTNAAHLMLAVPYYGRRWKSATTSIGAKSCGASYSAAVTYPNAVAAAENHGRQWDSNGSVPYYTYKSGTNAYQCFYDDAESLGLKYDYAKSKGLGGVGIWCLTHAPEAEELWELLGEKFDTYSGGGSGGGSGASAPAARATGIDASSALFSWTPAVADPAGYVVQSAPTPEGLTDGWWEDVPLVFSNSFSSAEGWVTNNVTTTTPTTVNVAGSAWGLRGKLELRPGITNYQDPGYVYLTYSNSYIQTPPVSGTVTQVAVRVRAAAASNYEGRKLRVLAAPAGSTGFTTVGTYACSNVSAILDYATACSISNPGGTVFRFENVTTGEPTTVLLHSFVATGTTTNWVAATGTPLADTCATNLTGLSSPVSLRVRNASSTNWSDIVTVTPGMVPSGMAADPAATNIALSWTAAPGAAAYQVDVASGPYTNWTATCPSASLGTNQFLSGQSWCYTGTVRTVTTSSNLGAGPGYCSTAKYAGHYLAGHPGQALLSWDFPLYGATSANLSFSNCPWNAANSTVGITCSVLRVYYRLDQGPWNFLGECRAASTDDEDWSAQSYDLPYLDGETLAVKIVAPYAERHADSTSGSLRGAGLKNIKLSFSGTTGRYCAANRPEGYPKTVTSPSDTIEGLSPETPYWIRVQALTENTRSVWVETTATTTEETGGDEPSTEITPVSTTWDFTVPEGWTECGSNFTGTTNVNGRAWELTGCRVAPAPSSDPTGGDTGYVYLYNPTNSCATTPAFAGVVTQVTTVFRPASSNVTRQASLYASVDGGTTFTLVGDCPVPLKQNYTNTFAFSPALDGGDFGVIFCASNSGTAGSIQWRRLTIDGTSTAPEEPDADSWSPFGTSTAEQPHGALSGIVLYVAAGHGFTANGQTNAWAAGRGITYGMVEDMGTIDQLNYFALQAWKAGATIVPMRPLGWQTNEVVIDNVDTAATLASRVTYGGNWGNTGQTDYYHGKAGEVGYRWANTCATGTTAWASFRPSLPAAGEYPVYVWARPGSDRVPQLYRVHHAGGVTDVRVDHRQVGNGWVWLGNYWFDAGTNGCVNISNFAPGFDDGTVIADAVRFGNGMGDISRGTAGKSGYERELEGARYWTQRMVLDSQGLPDSIYNSTASHDQDDNVSAPNRMAYAMCRTNDWPRWRRLYLSFHSNASGSQRGCMGLYDTRVTGSYLAGQTNLARCIANSIVSNMTAAHAHGLVATAWQQDCARTLGSHYGEIYGGSIWTKMDNTIAEVAFHDKELDAAIMKSPTGREWLARSALRGILRHFVTRYATDSTLTVREICAPDAPVAVAATNSGPNCVTVSWQMPHGTNRMSDPHTGFVIYVSTNGYAFGNPVAITSPADEYAHKFTDLPAGNPYYFRVCATNLGGESLSSPVAGAGLSSDGSTADVLVVDGFKRNDGAQSPTRYFANNLKGNVTLVRPRMINSFDYVKEHGNAIAAAGRSFDFMDASRVTSSDLARYPKVVWCLGEESTADETFSYGEQQLLAAFLDNGGALFVSGSEIGWDLSAKGSAADKAFMTNYLHCTYVADDGGSAIVSGKSGTFLANTRADFNYTNNLPDIYAANYPDTLAPVGEAFVAATYGGTSGTNGAIIACSNSVCRTVVMGYPFETIPDAARRNALMKKILDWFDAAQTAPAWTGETAYTTGVGGEITIDLKSQVTGFPSPAVTLVGTFDSRTGDEIDDSAYAIAEDIFIFEAPAAGAYTFTFRAENAAGSIEQEVTVTAGNAPAWQPLGDLLVDLDAAPILNLYQYVSGEYPLITLDAAHTVADEYTYSFDVGTGYLEINSSYPATNVFTFVASNTLGTASVTFTNAIRRLDTDSDGIPDWWAIAHFGGATACNPNLDPDADGFDNLSEYRLGTDPNDGASFFRLDAEADSTGTLLSWPSATGVTYQLSFTTNLLLPASTSQFEITNTPPVSWHLDTNSSPATFYHLRATCPLP
ncbi:MAG: fibronectin type III domain-containing protein [Kiritimatiellae bacterium]|nr:fibronectin type III domain-containing protein [Kiritimatiellia bacterium]